MSQSQWNNKPLVPFAALDDIAALGERFKTFTPEQKTQYTVEMCEMLGFASNIVDAESMLSVLLGQKHDPLAVAFAGLVAALRVVQVQHGLFKAAQRRAIAAEADMPVGVTVLGERGDA